VKLSDKHAYIGPWLPKNTTFAGPTTVHRDGCGSTAGVGVTMGTNGFSGNGNATLKKTHTKEEMRDILRITTHPSSERKHVKWAYDVQDPFQKQLGMEIVEHEKRPFPKF
jgi:hypothetical protein